MKTLPGTTKIVIVLAVAAAVGLTTVRALYAAKKPKPCPNTFLVTFGHDDPACKTDTTEIHKGIVHGLVKNLPIECYRVRYWKGHKPDPSGGIPAEEGELEVLKCKGKKQISAQAVPPMMQASGAHVTQRAYFATKELKEEFLKKAGITESETKKKK
ncbi:MAG TPA: hypothetical protein VJ719_03315 [Chthoniobacterales bacterium]|nr:hypothetical protein [Chthoniobacterales bacterium]